MLKSNICCERMKNDVVYNPKGVYEDDDVIIVAGKNDDELTFMCYDKQNKDTLPLGYCLWCGKDVDH
jgi:hypothetical protein